MAKSEKIVKPQLVDPDGNVLYQENQYVFLRLKARKTVRRIGWVEGGVFWTHRSSVHVFQKMKGYGFNWHLMRNAKFKRVCVVTPEGEQFAVDVERIMKEGEVLNFKRYGYELQVFLPIEKFDVVQKLVTQGEQSNV